MAARRAPPRAATSQAAAAKNHVIDLLEDEFRKEFPVVPRIIGPGGKNVIPIRAKFWAGVEVIEKPVEGVAARIVISHKQHGCQFKFAVAAAEELAEQVRRQGARREGSRRQEDRRHAIDILEADIRTGFRVFSQIIGTDSVNVFPIRHKLGARVEVIDKPAEGIAARIVVSDRRGCQFEAAVAAAEELAENVRWLGAKRESSKPQAASAEAVPPAARTVVPNRRGYRFDAAVAAAEESSKPQAAGAEAVPPAPAPEQGPAGDAREGELADKPRTGKAAHVERKSRDVRGGLRAGAVGGA